MTDWWVLKEWSVLTDWSVSTGQVVLTDWSVLTDQSVSTDQSVLTDLSVLTDWSVPAKVTLTFKTYGTTDMRQDYLKQNDSEVKEDKEPFVHLLLYLWRVLTHVHSVAYDVP